MIVLTENDILKFACKASGKYGMYIHFDVEHGNPDELLKSIPYLNSIEVNTRIKIEWNGYAYMFFDTEEEMNEKFDVTVCDNAVVSVYALTCGPDGEFMSENT